MGTIVTKRSETFFAFHCDLCNKDNGFVKAVGFCANCKDYLCEACYKYHLKPKLMRHHILLDQHKMPKSKPRRQSKDLCTEPCAEHKNKTLKYYCADHGYFSCSYCMILYHKNCEHLVTISKFAAGVLSSREYKDKKLQLKFLIYTAQQAIKVTQSQTKTSSQRHSDASEFFKQLKKDLITTVDKIETWTMTNLEKIRDNNQKRMKSVESQGIKLLKDIKALDSKFDSLENKGQHCQIFFSMKRSQDEISSFETSLLKLKNQNNIKEYVVKISDDLQNLIQRPENMASPDIFVNLLSDPIIIGGLAFYPHSQKLSSEDACGQMEDKQGGIEDEESRTEDEPGVVEGEQGLIKGEPQISGSVVLPGDKLVAVVNKYDKIELINLQNSKTVSSLKWVTGLWDVTAVTNTKVAVTSSEENNIVFFNVTDTLTFDHKVKVKGNCRGIVCINNNLVITYVVPVKVEVISQKGMLLQTVVTEDRGRQLFNLPLYVALSPNQQTLYISDYSRSTVTSLDLSGQFKAIYEDEELVGTCGLTVDKAGLVYVCGLSSHNIYMLSPDLHKIQILVQKSDGYFRPWSVSYHEEYHTLASGMYRGIAVIELMPNLDSTGSTQLYLESSGSTHPYAKH